MRKTQYSIYSITVVIKQSSFNTKWKMHIFSIIWWLISAVDAINHIWLVDELRTRTSTEESSKINHQILWLLINWKAHASRHGVNAAKEPEKNDSGKMYSNFVRPCFEGTRVKQLRRLLLLLLSFLLLMPAFGDGNYILIMGDYYSFSNCYCRGECPMRVYGLPWADTHRMLRRRAKNIHASHLFLFIIVCIFETTLLHVRFDLSTWLPGFAAKKKR